MFPSTVASGYLAINSMVLGFGGALNSKAMSQSSRFRTDTVSENLLTPASTACGPIARADPMTQNSLLACLYPAACASSERAAFAVMRCAA